MMHFEGCGYYSTYLFQQYLFFFTMTAKVQARYCSSASIRSCAMLTVLCRFLLLLCISLIAQSAEDLHSCIPFTIPFQWEQSTPPNTYLESTPSQNCPWRSKSTYKQHSENIIAASGQVGPQLDVLLWFGDLCVQKLWQPKSHWTWLSMWHLLF